VRFLSVKLYLYLTHSDERADIKLDNIFVKFRDRSLIESDYLVNVPIPQQDKAEEKYTPVRSTSFRRCYFGEADRAQQIPEFDIALGDWGVASWATQHLTERIQPVLLRAPEVLIEAPWDKTVDWWNLGALLLELYRAVRMFDGRVPPDGYYELKEHASEIVDFFGPFPKELLEKGNQDLVRSIFDDEGRPKDCPPGRLPPLASEALMPGLSDEARVEFASFLTALMKINPAERPPVVDIMKHPWITMRR
jgi:serine/threonine-protein kinase SRPK3